MLLKQTWLINNNFVTLSDVKVNRKANNHCSLQNESNHSTVKIFSRQNIMFNLELKQTKIDKKFGQDETSGELCRQ